MAIADTLIAKPPPLRLDESGTLRVGGTRVTLDTVVAAWWLPIRRGPAPRRSSWPMTR
jgi:hypothetical protein